jgi:hypothetical protein
MHCHRNDEGVCHLSIHRHYLLYIVAELYVNYEYGGDMLDRLPMKLKTNFRNLTYID